MSLQARSEGVQLGKTPKLGKIQKILSNFGKIFSASIILSTFSKFDPLKLTPAKKIHFRNLAPRRVSLATSLVSRNKIEILLA